MNGKTSELKSWLIAAALMASSVGAQATCYKVTGIGTSTSMIPQELANQGYTANKWGGVLGDATASIAFGTIIMGTGAQSLAKAGTLLASADLPFLDKALKVPYTANQIVFKCALSDADSLYEMYALYGSMGAFYGGKAVTDVTGAYQTPITNIAYRITNMKTGNYYTGYWQQRQLTSADYITYGSNIYIPASAFSDTRFELLKTDDFYGVIARDAFKQVTSPQGFIAFKGNGMNVNLTTGTLATSPSPLETSAVWSMYGGTTIVIRGNTCTLGDFDQVVKLPPISASNLRNGETSSNTFNVAINCESGAISGTVSNDINAPVALGFLVTQPAALSQASTLGLQTSSGGISYLLDDNYGASGVASGVGIRLYSSASKALNLLSSSTTTGTGSGAGWYGYTELMNETGTTESGGKSYAGTFTASLEQLPGATAQAGSVNAQAQIIVSLQ
ncbi:fimbrial usher protein StbD [Pantoea sp. C2G6]|uniref:fimbrial usher protein StbD n=1 Tax=Pantoea sp. C2G6 TaxID=3243084 RepID=UPI003ED8E449